jgi:uncharacterized protein with GYD domain
MATFISMMNFTEQGIQAVGETTKRAAAMKSSAKKMGVKIVSTYWTLGAHDGVLILEAPDGETATAFLLQLGMRGNVKTTTSRAFSASEMDQVLAKMNS